MSNTDQMAQGYGTNASMHAPAGVRANSAPPTPANAPAGPQTPDPNTINLNEPMNEGTPQERARLQQILAGMVEAQLAPLRQELQEKEAEIWSLGQQIAATQQAAAGMAPHVKVKVREPEHFYGDRTKFQNWISQINLFFSLTHQTLRTDRDRVLYACSCIKGEAYTYVKHTVDSATINEIPDLPELDNYDLFHSRLSMIFGPVDAKGEAQRKLVTLKQKQGVTVEQFAAEFQRWRILSEFDQDALRYHFYDGLQQNIRLALAPEYQRIGDVDALMRRAAEIDVNLRIAHRQPLQSTAATASSAPAVENPISSAADPNAMDIGRMQIQDLQQKVPKEEWGRRLRERCCLNCGRQNHRFYRCRSKFSTEKPPPPSGQRAAVATTPAPPTPSAPSQPPTPSATSPDLALASQASVNRMIALLEGAKLQPQSGF